MGEIPRTCTMRATPQSIAIRSQAQVMPPCRMIRDEYGQTSIRTSTPPSPIQSTRNGAARTTWKEGKEDKHISASHVAGTWVVVVDYYAQHAAENPTDMKRRETSISSYQHPRPASHVAGTWVVVVDYYAAIQQEKEPEGHIFFQGGVRGLRVPVLRRPQAGTRKAQAHKHRNIHTYVCSVVCLISLAISILLTPSTT